MRTTAIFPLLLAALVSCQEENDKFTVLSKRKLAGGKELHTIQEHLDDDELPELPNEDDEIEVPVDEQGNVLPGYEHLLVPKVIVINREQLEKLNNSKPVSELKPDGIVVTEKGPIEPYAPKDFVIPAIPVRPLDKNDIDEETAGADYDEAAVPDLQLPTVQDYVDSKEKDPEVETADGVSENELQKVEALNKITQEIEEKKEKEDPKKEKEEIQEDVKAIIKEAEQEFNSAIEKEEKAEEEGLKELIKEISDDVLDDKKTEEKEEVSKILIAGKGPEVPTEKGYVLDGTIDDEPKEEEVRQPTRIHKGQVIGRREPKPDSANQNQLLTALMIFFTLIFV